MRKSDAEPKPPIKKPAVFVGSSLKDLRELPNYVQGVFGRAILNAQWGGKTRDAKPLKGYRGAGVLEIVEDFQTDTYRAIYTLRFDSAIYVLHIFQKKSTQGIKTSEKDLSLIASRLKTAEANHLAFIAEESKIADEERKNEK